MRFSKRSPEKIQQAKDEKKAFLKPYEDMLIELFADRGMLLGSTTYTEMTGVERYEALDQIDKKIIAVKNRIEQEELRWKKILKSL